MGWGSGIWPQRDPLGTEALHHPGPCFMLGALAFWLLGPALTKPMPPGSVTFPCPHLTQSPELMLSPSTSEGLSSKEMATCDSKDPVLICGASGSSDLQPGQHADPGKLVCSKERATASPACQGRSPLSWPQPTGHCLVTWLLLLKCHFLSGPYWVYLLGPLLGLLTAHRLWSQALAAQNSFMRGSHHSNSQPCWARPACAAGPGREGVWAHLASGAWVLARSLKKEEDEGGNTA